MESITKNRQPEQTLRAMAERAYGPGQVPAASADWVSELGDGWFNVAYRLRLPAAERDAYRGPAFGPLGGPGDPSWRVIFTGMAQDVLRDGERRRVDLGWDYDVVRDVLARNASLPARSASASMT
jgi:hypothetical protein